MKILVHTPTGTTKPYPRSDNEPVVGLSAEYETFDMIEEPRPTYDSATHNLRRLPEAIDQTAKTVTRGWEIVPCDIAPVVVTMRSFRLAAGRSLMNQINAAIDAIEDIDQCWQAQQFLAASPTVSRSHPLVLSLAAALGKSAEAVDAIFSAAQTLDSNL
jgi:hypothetical protein